MAFGIERRKRLILFQILHNCTLLSALYGIREPKFISLCYSYHNEEIKNYANALGLPIFHVFQFFNLSETSLATVTSHNAYKKQ
jgi:hypothetical protein